MYTAVWLQIIIIIIPRKIEQLHLRPRCDPNGYNYSKSEWTSNSNTHHQMQFNLIPGTENGFKYCYLTQIILFNICIQLNDFK